MKLTRRKFVAAIASSAGRKQKPEVLERLAAEFSEWNRQTLPRIERS